MLFAPSSFGKVLLVGLSANPPTYQGSTPPIRFANDILGGHVGLIEHFAHRSVVFFNMQMK